MNGKALKERARRVLKQNRKLSMFAVFVVLVMGSSVGVPEFLVGTLAEFIWPLIYFVFVVGPISAGISWFFLDIYDEQEGILYSSMFQPVRNYRKVALLMFIINVLTAIGMVFFFVPGLLIALLLSQAVYLLKENPESSVGACLKGSYVRMKGHVFRLLGIILSFVVYLVPGLLALGLPLFGIVGPEVGAFLIMGAFLYFIVIGFYLFPLFNTVMAGFYREVISRQDFSK